MKLFRFEYDKLISSAFLNLSPTKISILVYKKNLNTALDGAYKAISIAKQNNTLAPCI